ncbi:hypothetical protein PZA11_007911 [Diplocarpon coronariae]|nr:hypothetical protein JHW43_003970 [Diplocarpon mali]
MKLLSEIHIFLSNISNKCLKVLSLKPPPPTKHVRISPPFNLTEGPAIHFPGYSEDDISLMREKALASTAVVEEGRFELCTGRVVPRSRSGSSSCGFGEQVAYHARRASNGCLY